MMNLKKQIDIAVICEPSCQSLLEIINDLVFNIKNINPDLNIQIHYVLNHISISHCILCKECFKTSFCKLDAIDRFDNAKQIIEVSDLVIIGSPVLGNNVSGIIKTFIDRTSYWMHLMNLIGKTAIICVSAKNTGYNDVVKYLYEVCSNFGLTVIGVICKTSMVGQKELKARQDQIIRNFMDIYSLNLNILGNMYLRDSYRMYRDNFAWIPKDKVTFENTYWVKRKKYENLDLFLSEFYESQ